jgi:hypothetical protein
MNSVFYYSKDCNIVWAVTVCSNKICAFVVERAVDGCLRCACCSGAANVCFSLSVSRLPCPAPLRRAAPAAAVAAAAQGPTGVSIWSQRLLQLQLAL